MSFARVALYVPLLPQERAGLLGSLTSPFKIDERGGVSAILIECDQLHRVATEATDVRCEDAANIAGLNFLTELLLLVPSDRASSRLSPG